MIRLIKILLLAALLAGVAREGRAFSLLGQFKSWQVTDIGYQLPGDIGGPQLGNEGYRWNIPTIYYAYDSSFITYFGKPGMAAVDSALRVFNQLPAFSAITNDGFSLYIRGEIVPTDSRGPQNFAFAEAGLIDLKSIAMQAMIEELGLAEPTRFTWTMRGRFVDGAPTPPITNYSVVKLHYDPITLQPSSFVNGVLLDYDVVEPLRVRGIDYVDALEAVASPPAPYFFSAVADRLLGQGTYFFGLTHDDVGGLRYLYNRNNFATEALLTNVTGSVLGTSPWGVYLGTNVLTTNTLGTNVLNNVVVTGVRRGLNKLNFQRVRYDSLVSQLFVPFTNNYTDTVITNSRAVRQSLSRGLIQPDLLFVAEDLGLVLNYVPFWYSRTDTASWQNNDAINGNDIFTPGDPAFGGPGVINPQIRIAFSDQLPYWLHFTPDFVFGREPPPSAVWATFDENTVEPIVYPLFLDLNLGQIQQLAR